MKQRLPETAISGVLKGLFSSAATFKKCMAEKAAFILLGLIDMALTALAMNLNAFEINPFMRLAVQIPAVLLLIKFFIPVLIAWLVPGKFLWPAIALLVFVVTWNIMDLASYYYPVFT